MRFRMPLRGFALLLLMLLALRALGDGRWTIHGPDGGNVRRLFFDPGDPSVVYAAAFNGLFRSADGGRHWLGAEALLGTDILDVAVAKSDPRIVYAASAYGLYKSTDRGLSWSLIQTSGAFSLAVGAGNADVVYNASIAGLVRSTDGAVTFGNRGSGLPSGLPSGLAVDPQNASIVYASFPSSSGVYKSTDGGAHWSQANSGLTASQVFSLAVDTSDGATLFAGGGASTIFKSTDGATSWTPLTTGFSDLTCSGLTVSPSSPATILAATNHGPLISRDGGASWNRGAGFLDASTTAVAVDPIDPATYLAAVFLHVYRTVDGGATAVASESGLTSFVTQGIAVDPGDDAVIYAAGPAGLARSADHGRTWSLSTSLQPVKVAVDANASTIYAVSGTVQRSVDGGNTWSIFGTGLQAVQPTFLAADPQLSGTLYAVVNGAVYKKIGEDPWMNRSSGLPDSMDFVTIDPHASSTVYAGGPAGVFKSSNGGATWAPANVGLTGLNSIGLSVDPFDSRHLFAWSPTQVFESIDGAATWSMRTGVRGEMYFDSAAAGVVLASTFNDVQRSADGGKTWFSLAQGLPRTHSLFAVGAHGTLYLAGSSGGVFVFSVARRHAVGR